MIKPHLTEHDGVFVARDDLLPTRLSMRARLRAVRKLLWPRWRHSLANAPRYSWLSVSNRIHVH